MKSMMWPCFWQLVTVLPHLITEEYYIIRNAILNYLYFFIFFVKSCKVRKIFNRTKNPMKWRKRVYNIFLVPFLVRKSRFKTPYFFLSRSNLKVLLHALKRRLVYVRLLVYPFLLYLFVNSLTKQRESLVKIFNSNSYQGFVLSSVRPYVYILTTI